MKSSIPSHLSSHNAQGITAFTRDQRDPLAQFEIGPSKNFVYLILDWTKKKAAIVDPQKDLTAPLEALKNNGFELEGILLTHTHFDHIAGVPELSQKFPALPIYVHPADAHRLSLDRNKPREGKTQIHPLSHGQTIQIGNVRVQVLHTPGHSPGECCYWIEGPPSYLLTGDTIFIRDCGRTDLEGGSNPEMFQSIQLIKTLPAHTIILPGHHYQKECASTLETEMRESPPFQCKSVAELSALP